MREKPLILNKFRSDSRVAAPDSCSPSSVVGGQLMMVGDGNDVLVPQNSRFHMRAGAQRGQMKCHDKCFSRKGFILKHWT